jgi:hypothetical protein
VSQVTKGHGRLEIRELWLEEACELGAYLEAEYGWPGLRRWRCRLSGRSELQGWQVQELVWVAGGCIQHLSVQQALECLRGHWEIENRLYWVRDVSFPEDRLPGREVAPGFERDGQPGAQRQGRPGPEPAHRLITTTTARPCSS